MLLLCWPLNVFICRVRADRWISITTGRPPPSSRPRQRFIAFNQRFAGWSSKSQQIHLIFFLHSQQVALAAVQKPTIYNGKLKTPIKNSDIPTTRLVFQSVQCCQHIELIHCSHRGIVFFYNKRLWNFYSFLLPFIPLLYEINRSGTNIGGRQCHSPCAESVYGPKYSRVANKIEDGFLGDDKNWLRLRVLNHCYVPDKVCSSRVNNSWSATYATVVQNVPWIPAGTFWYQ